MPGRRRGLARSAFIAFAFAAAAASPADAQAQALAGDPFVLGVLGEWRGAERVRGG